MTDQEAERVIAEWLGVKIYQGKMSTLTIADGGGHYWTPATDANLWFGEEGLFAVLQDRGLAEAFTFAMNCHICSVEPWCGQIGNSSEWTRALAAAIKEAAGG